MTLRHVDFYEALDHVRKTSTAECDLCGIKKDTIGITVHLKDGMWLVVCFDCKYDLVHRK